MIGVVITFVCLLGSLLTKSKKLVEITVVSVLLNVAWIIGYLIIKRMLKDIDHVQYRNLNGHNSFEMLMIYC